MNTDIQVSDFCHFCCVRDSRRQQEKVMAIDLDLDLDQTDIFLQPHIPKSNMTPKQTGSSINIPSVQNRILKTGPVNFGS